MASRSNKSRQSDFFSFDGEAQQSRRRDSEKSDFFSFDGEAEQSRRGDFENSRLSSNESFRSTTSRQTLKPTTPRSPDYELAHEYPPPLPSQYGPALESMFRHQQGLAEHKEKRARERAMRDKRNEDLMYNAPPKTPPAAIGPKPQSPRNVVVAPAEPRDHIQMPGTNQLLERDEGKKWNQDFFSRNVTYLSRDNFEQFIAPLEKALIYFHDSISSREPDLEDMFSNAADTTRHQGYGFGVIDCGYEPGLCELYKISWTPSLKLFSNGFEVSTINKPKGFSAQGMKQLMVMTPVLNKPREDVGKDFMERTKEHRAAAQAQMTPTRPGKFCWQ